MFCFQGSDFSVGVRRSRPFLAQSSAAAAILTAAPSSPDVPSLSRSPMKATRTASSQRSAQRRATSAASQMSAIFSATNPSFAGRGTQQTSGRSASSRSGVSSELSLSAVIDRRLWPTKKTSTPTPSYASSAKSPSSKRDLGASHSNPETSASARSTVTAWTPHHHTGSAAWSVPTLHLSPGSSSITRGMTGNGSSSARRLSRSASADIRRPCTSTVVLRGTASSDRTSSTATSTARDTARSSKTSSFPTANDSFVENRSTCNKITRVPTSPSSPNATSAITANHIPIFRSGDHWSGRLDRQTCLASRMCGPCCNTPFARRLMRASSPLTSQKTGSIASSPNFLCRSAAACYFRWKTASTAAAKPDTISSHKMVLSHVVCGVFKMFTKWY